MTRLWLIRIIFSLPILLCAAGWLGSTWYSGYFGRTYHGYWIGISSTGGSVGGNLNTPSPSRPLLRPNEWKYHLEQLNSPIFSPEFPAYTHSFLGFGYRSVPDLSSRYIGSVYSIFIPFWFLITVFSTALFFVWRKTRPNPKSAFPIEVKT